MDLETTILLAYLEDLRPEFEPVEEELRALARQYDIPACRPAADAADELIQKQPEEYVRIAHLLQARLPREVAAFFADRRRIGSKTTFPAEVSVRREQLKEALLAGRTAEALKIADAVRSGACAPWVDATTAFDAATDWAVYMCFADLMSGRSVDLQRFRTLVQAMHVTGKEVRQRLQKMFDVLANARPDLDLDSGRHPIRPRLSGRKKTNELKKLPAHAPDPRSARLMRERDRDDDDDRDERETRGRGRRRRSRGEAEEEEQDRAEAGRPCLGMHTINLHLTAEKASEISLLVVTGGAIATPCDGETGLPVMRLPLDGAGVHPIAFLLFADRPQRHELEVVVRYADDEVVRLPVEGDFIGSLSGHVPAREKAAVTPLFSNAVLANATATLAPHYAGFGAPAAVPQYVASGFGLNNAGPGSAGLGAAAAAGFGAAGAAGGNYPQPPAPIAPRSQATPTEAPAPVQPRFSPPQPESLHESPASLSARPVAHRAPSPAGSTGAAEMVSRTRAAAQTPNPPVNVPDFEDGESSGSNTAPVAAGPGPLMQPNVFFPEYANLPVAPPEPLPCLPADLAQYHGTKTGFAMATLLRDKVIHETQLRAIGGAELVMRFGVDLREACQGKDWNYKLEMIKNFKVFRLVKY